jgi:N-acetylmuramic acid 6-phosphate etherase
MLPPFRKCQDTASPRPWAFVKHPLLSTVELWQQHLKRELRCLEWSVQDYISLGAPESVQTAPPLISAQELYKFQVGCENVADRIVSGKDAAVLFSLGANERKIDDAFSGIAEKFNSSYRLCIGNGSGDFCINCSFPDGELKLMEHLAAKLVLNTISTGTMTCLGRVTGNWMSFVAVSNKKLIDRAIRLVSEIGKISYEDACLKLFEAIDEIARTTLPGEEQMSAVQYVLAKLKEK